MNLRLIISSIFALISFYGSAQTLDYYSQLNQPTTYGDARFNGLAGSMTAMSGSFTALALNPAGAGLYRQEAFGTDFGIFSKRNTLDNGAVRGNTTTLNLGNIGMLGRDQASGWNYFFTFNSDQLFRERIRDTRSSAASMTQQWVDGSEGTPPDFLPELGAYEDLLYQSYATDYDANTMSYNSTANLSDVDFTHTYFRKGIRSRATFGGGKSYGKTLYYGASVSLLNSSENVEIEHNELYNSTTDLTGLDLTDQWDNRAIGFSANMGILYRPVQFLRIAAALELPHVYSFTQDWEVSIRAVRPSISASGITGEGYGEEYMWSMITAPKLRSGATIVLGRSALFTVNHTLIPHTWSSSISRNERYLNPIIKSQLSTQHQVSAGGELRFGLLTLRSGIAYSPSYREGLGDYWRLGGGASIRVDETTLYMSWSQTSQQMQYYPFSADYIDPIIYTSRESMLSFGALWKF